MIPVTSLRNRDYIDIIEPGRMHSAAVFARSTTATYFDATGVMQMAAANQPRIDHDPVTGDVRGLLLEDQSTNLLANSSTIGGTGWTNTNASANQTLNGAIAPDGTQTATVFTAPYVVDTGGSWNLRWYRSINSSAAGINYAFSCFAKYVAGAMPCILCLSSDAGGVWAYFDLKTGTLSGTTDPARARIEAIGGGWYRCSLHLTTTAADASDNHFITLANRNTSTYDPPPFGDEVVHIWGAQVEVGTFPTSYIPTTTAAVTRGTDSVGLLIPPRVNRLVKTYSDGTASQQAVTPGASYTLSAEQKPILRVRGYFA